MMTKSIFRTIFFRSTSISSSVMLAMLSGFGRLAYWATLVPARSSS